MGKPRMYGMIQKPKAQKNPLERRWNKQLRQKKGVLANDRQRKAD